MISRILRAEGDGEGLEGERGDVLVGGVGAGVLAGLHEDVVDDGLRTRACRRRRR